MTLKRNLILLVLFTNAYFVTSQQVVLPPSIQLCPRSSPNIANCIRNSIDILRPYLKTGQLGNGFVLEGIDPMRFDDFILERGRGFYFHLLNIKAYKLTNFKIEKLRVNLKTLEIEVILEVPVIDTTGDYRMNMQLGILKINGQGKYKSHLENVKMRLKLKGALYTDNNGIEYAKFIAADVKVKLPKLIMTLDNLFKDKLLNDLGNDLINQNSQLFIEEIEANSAKSFSKTALKAGNQILQKIPFNVLFP